MLVLGAERGGFHVPEPGSSPCRTGAHRSWP